LPKNKKEHQEKQSVEIPLQNYLLFNVITHLPAFYALVLLFYYYFPLMKLIHLNTLFGLTSSVILGIDNFWLYIFAPLYLIGEVVLFIALQVGMAKIFDIYWNHKSPPTEGLFQRTFGKKDVLDMRIKYYHYRGYIIKDPLWYASKSPFPWLINWVLKTIGHNEIEKGVTYIDAAPSLEFTTIRKDAIILMGVVYSSHVVDSLYGNLTIKRVTIGENSVLYPGSIYAPGTNIGKDCNFLPHSMTPKDFATDEEHRFYNGTPAKSYDQSFGGVLSLLDSKATEIFKEKGFLSGEEINQYLLKK
jgi:hypothetical protein